MPRQLKTYVTTSGFFELAVAAPTMKAALEIWGAGPDLFRRGYAKETNDAATVKAMMAKPGIILRRPVGTNGDFKEHADLPDLAAIDNVAKPYAADKPASPATLSGPTSKRPIAPPAAKAARL